MNNIPEEYGIANTLRYGEPNKPEQHVCNKCGKMADCWGETSGYKCFECAREEFDDLTDEEAVELLGFEVIEE